MFRSQYPNTEIHWVFHKSHSALLLSRIIGLVRIILLDDFACQEESARSERVNTQMTIRDAILTYSLALFRVLY